MSTEQSSSNSSKAAKLSVRPRNSRRGLLYVSLVLNGLFIVAAVGLFALCNVRTYWFSAKLHSAYQRTCPTNVSTHEDTKRSGSIQTTTYYVTSQSLESGCADQIMQQAQLDDYRAYPDHARISADMFRQLTPSHTLNVTVVKSAETNTQLAPLQVKR